jgi:hypothetical protein
MILKNDGQEITPTIAAKHLVYHFGGQLDSMDSDEWDWVLRPCQLTDAEVGKISQAIDKQLARVKRFLGV